VAGCVLAALGRLPKTGEHVEAGRWRFEVVDLDDNCIDSVIATPSTPSEMAGVETLYGVPHRLA